MAQSKMYAKIKRYYEQGNWPAAWVGDAVKKGKITPEEYEQITGEAYAA